MEDESSILQLGSTLPVGGLERRVIDKRSVSVEDLLVLARADPNETLSRARAVVGSFQNSDEDKSIAYRAMSIAARHAETIEDSIAYGRESVSLAESAGNASLRSAALGTLSGSMTIAGDAETALKVLREATEGAEGLLKAQLTFQRGAILENQGHGNQALKAYSQALPIFREERNEEFEALTLRNRGNLEVLRGDLGRAESDLLASRKINEKLGLTSEIAGLDLNLGTLFSYQGDLPEALSRFSAGDSGLMEIRGDDTPQHVGRCEVLISAGLYTEAMELAREIATKNQAAGDIQHASLAYLVAARAALLANQLDVATDLAESATEPYAGHEVEPWLLQVKLISLIAQYKSEGPSRELAEAAEGIAPLLDSGRSVASGAEARLLAGRVLLELGALSLGRSILEEVIAVPAGPVETRLQAIVARALIRTHSGDFRGADAAARAGINLLDEYQASLGASDLRTGIESWGKELGELGLRLAVRSGNSRRVFRWMERTRARALVHPIVLPSHDDAEREALSELRRLEAQLRLDKEPDRGLIRRRRRLQELIKQYDRARSGGEKHGPGMSIIDLISGLDASDLVEFAFVKDQIWAVHVKKGRFYLHQVGSRLEVENELHHLRFHMRKAARRGRADGLVASIRRIDDLLLKWLRTESDVVVIVPPPGLIAAPWAAFPTLAEVDLVVAPSAEVWYRAQMIEPTAGDVLLVGGPDLELAARELSDIATIYPTSRILNPDEATVAATIKAMSSAGLLHIASHATFSADSPMFSSLHLADGDLNIYDIERLGRIPSTVVLSACDSGFTDSRPGEELTGLTSALLRMGAKTVIASVGLVPDSEATRQFMVGFHTGLANGHTPAHALRLARDSVLGTPGGDIAAASFICVGSS